MMDAMRGGGGWERWKDRIMRSRIAGALMLDAAVYREVKHDESAIGQAAGTVALAALGGWVGGTGAAAVGTAVGGPLGGIYGALAGWLTWTAVAYLVGVRLLGGRARVGELLRTLGFAQAPGILFAAAALPFIGGLVGMVVNFWLVAAVVVALREALDVSTVRAVLTAVLGFVGVSLLLRLIIQLYLLLPAL